MTMNITEAIQAFRNEGVESPAFQEIVNRLIDTNTKIEFSNDSYLDALKLTELMFKRTKSSLRLLTGPCGEEFLRVLEDSFVGSLERLRAANGSARIVVLGDVTISSWLKELMKRFSGVLQVCLAVPSNPVKHFIVCDSRMARLEEVHKPLLPESPATDVKATVYFSEPDKAKVFEQHFDQIWKIVEVFPANRALATVA